MIRRTTCLAFTLALAILPAAVWAAPAAGTSVAKSVEETHPDIFWPRARDFAQSDPQQRQGDPLAAISGQMLHITGELAAARTSDPVPGEQKQVLGELDELIKELEKQCKGSSGGASANPTKPMQRSQLTGGPGGSGPMHDPHAGTRVWGQLPPKEREKILQSQTEGFPPGYESVLSSYYSRLAQVDAAPEGDSPTTRHDSERPAAGHP